MRVLIVNTSEQIGGAAIAAQRLTEALNRHGVQAHMAVRDKQSTRSTTLRLPQRLRLRWAFLWERFRIWAANGFQRQGLWSVDIASAGVDLTCLQAFREADVIHLHWVNQGLLSLRQVRQLLDTGKPVVWTMHDMWPCTGICHHARECERFHTHCSLCPQLRRPGDNDLSWKVFRQKKEMYAAHQMTFVACSEWLATEARKSSLLKGQRICVIPNTYDAAVFCPASQAAARQRYGLPERGRLLLFACQKVTNVRKGLDYLLSALRSLRMRGDTLDLGLVVVGQLSEQLQHDLPFPVYSLGYLSGDAAMAQLYQAVDLFVTPSLEENLPNTIMEAMACGTPCVGFHVGGIPEMIDHQVNGYVARYCDVSDMAAGISYALSPAHHDNLAAAAAKKALSVWSEESVVAQYLQVYQSSLTPLSSKQEV